MQTARRALGLKMLRDLAALTSGRLAGSVVAFVGFAHLARVLTPASYGYVELAAWIVVLGTMVIDGGLGTIGTREISHDPARAGELAALIPASQLVLAIALFPLAVVLPFWMGQPREAMIMIWMFSAGLFFVPRKLDWLFQGVERMNVTGYFYAFRTAVFVGGVLLFVRAEADFFRVGWIELAAAGSMALYFAFFQVRFVGPVRFRFRWHFIREYLPRGFHVCAGNIVWTIIQTAPVFLLASLAGDEQTAWFAAPLRIVVALLTLSWVYLYNLYPTLVKVHHRGAEELLQTLKASLRLCAWGSCLLTLILGLLAEPLLKLAYGAKFGPSAPVFAVLVWVLPATLLSGHFRWALIAAGKEVRVVWSNLFGLVAVIAIGWSAIAPLGSLGAAWALLGSGLTVLLAAAVWAHRDLGLGLAARGALLPVGWSILLFVFLPHLEWGPWSTAAIAAGLFALGALADRRLLDDARRLARLKR